MNELHFPWPEVSVLISLFGAIWVGRVRNPTTSSLRALAFHVLALVATVGAWIDFEFLNSIDGLPHDAEDLWYPLTPVSGRNLFVIDQLNAPLLSLVALLYFLVSLTTFRRISFPWMLASEAIVLAMYSSNDPWSVIVLLAAGTIPPYMELRSRNENTGVYVKHMTLFVVLLVIGWTFVEWEGNKQPHSLLAIIPLLIAVFIRSGIAPFHCLLSDLFDRTTFGIAILVEMPLVGAYAAVRLVLPIAPDWVMKTIGLLSLLSAVYAAGICLVQIDVRRFFCYLFLSYSSLVLVGLEAVTPTSLTGALCVWLAVSVSLSGFGLTLRAL